MKLFFNHRFYWTLIGLAVGFMISFYISWLFPVMQLAAWLFIAAVIAELYLLFGSGGNISAERQVAERLSNGDQNQVELAIESSYRLTLRATILDELPEQLQIRDFEQQLELTKGLIRTITYMIVPKTRGIYQFGFINILIAGPIGFVSRRFKAAQPQECKNYPSYIHINHLELAAISQSLTKFGQKRIRKTGNSQEFDHIRNYVIGDDPRHINWKASAKRNQLQVNHFTDEKSQDVYCLVDKSRAMQMPFEGMTLLDYAINASLVLSHVALKKSDQAGLFTFENRPSTFLKSGNRPMQINQIMEALYAEKTSFNEVDFSSVYTTVQHQIYQRSLLILFTNFESIHSLERQLPYLKLLNRKHLLLAIFFRNTEVDVVADREVNSIKGIYTKGMAYQMLEEKKLINEKLKQSGILSLYTTPQNLSVDVLNRYIEIKAKRML